MQDYEENDIFLLQFDYVFVTEVEMPLWASLRTKFCRKKM